MGSGSTKGLNVSGSSVVCCGDGNPFMEIPAAKIPVCSRNLRRLINSKPHIVAT
jgi:hypothetical protein